MGLAFFPVAAALWQGQDSILAGLLFTATFVSLKRGRNGLAGCLIALALYKPHLVIPVAVMFVYMRQWSAVLGFAVTGVALVLLSTVLVGWQATIGYWQLLSELAENNYSIDPMIMANLRGLLEYLFAAAVPVVVVQGLIVAASIAVLVWAMSAWKGKVVPDNPMFDLKFAQLVVVTLLLSYHLYVHDLSLLALALIIMLNGALRPGRNDLTLLGLTSAAFIALSLPVAQLLLQKGLMPLLALLLLVIAAALNRQISLTQERLAIAQVSDN